MKIKLSAAVLAGMALVACSDSPNRTQSADRHYQDDTYMDNYYIINQHTSNEVTRVNKTKVKNKILPASAKSKPVSLTKTSSKSATKTRSTRSTSSRRR